MELVKAEIETEEQERLLKELGCTLGQGFRYGRPEPISNLQMAYAVTP